MKKIRRPSLLPVALAVSAVLLGVYSISLYLGNAASSVEAQSKQTQKYVELIKYFGGYNSKQDTLLVLANNAELRFGGGFIGSVGLISAKDGKVNSQPIQGVYSIDSDKNNQFSKYQPPHYMNTLTKILGLRDSNTQLNWPDDAERAIYYYALNTNKKAQNVVQISPNMIDALLEKLGPVYLKKYDKTISHQNFRDSVQLEVESGIDKQNKLDPKSGILGDLANELFARLVQKDLSELSQYIPLLEKLVSEKQLLVYSSDPHIQQLISSLGASGELKKTDENYFMYAEANIVANKDSPYIKNSIDMQQTINLDGSSTVQTTINSLLDTDYRYEYLDPNINKKLWLVGDDISYVKVLLPPGTKIISMTGEKNNKLINLEEVESGSSEGKHAVGFLRRLKPYESQKVTLVYSVPTHYVLSTNVVVNLVMQKQLGGWPYDFHYALVMPDKDYQLKAASVSPVERLVGSLNTVVYNDRVNTDKILSFIYDKK
ncbi:DUF4012 domain-containing protein [Candidatus Saccharibacteria bacterium]|nr:DUF4012 domain-containing protein [Candidatus Saccharibacteria bacterium]